jgi:PAS domain S-box-containing protein
VGRDGENAWRYLIEHIQDAVVEFEFAGDEPIIRSVNSAFVDVFGYERDALVGASLNEYIVPDWLAEEASDLDQRTASGEINHRRVKRETAHGLKEFLYRSVPYGAESESSDGFAIYTDLTDNTRNERRLEVLNRVLRHNLRNRVTVIAGNVTYLQDQLKTDAHDSTMQTIATTANDLRSLTTEAARIQSLLEDDGGETGSVDVVPVIDEVVARFRSSHPDADIGTERPAAAHVRGTDELETALGALVENAIEHNPGDVPRVRVRLEPIESEWIDVIVEDDGPLIPDAERNVVTGEAEITPTRHGSGLGLWLVRWTAERFGGELAFGESDFGGNAVRMRLQARDPE